MSVHFYQEDKIGYIEFNDPEAKVNILSAAVLKRLDTIINEIAKSPLTALVILSKKKDVFIAGADIKEIEQITDPKEGVAKAKAGQDIFNKIEDLKYPTIALIDGVALGGGCELLLACQYRVATFNPKVSIGLPEVNLGFVPGFGGTYRLPRIVGLEEGLKMILTGKPVNAEKALKIGLVDRLITQASQKSELSQFITDIQQKKFHPNKFVRYPKKGMATILSESLIYQCLAFRAARKNVLKQSHGFYPAPLKAIELIRQSFYDNRKTALRREREMFGPLGVTEISKNLIHVFYISEKYRKLSLPQQNKTTTKRITKSGVIGAGIMGGGIAQLLSAKDIWIRMKDINHEAIAKGLQAASKIYQSEVKKRKFPPAIAQAKMGHISGSLDYTGFAQMDLVIEAVVENIDVKKKIFKELSNVAPQAILATNTSALSVEAMAKETKNPSRVIGIHFFNPVHRMPLVEIITTPLTSPETVATTLDFVKNLGKTPIIVKDSCGFIVNRILLSYLNEAGRILEECGDIPKIDRIMTNFGMPMGPFTLTDEVGADVGIKVLHTLEESFGERFKPVRIFDQMITKGFLGKKTGKGFYLHDNSGTINPALKDFVRTPLPVSPVKEKEYQERMVYLMINEAARCLEEKIVEEADAIDVGMIFGTGFPPFRGGLLKYADSIGVENIVRALEHYQRHLKADRFMPCGYLRHMVDLNQSFNCS